jgi:ABC-type polysaccharide/polyol phosphate transport system ATPase subunit
VDAEILLLDEVIGVGDASFQEKAARRLEQLHARAEIVVLAIHNPQVIRQSCNKALWLERGTLRSFGAVDTVLADYAQHTGLTVLTE